MRFIEVPEKADILVSELLGSFGDNELSPECLDGAQRFLKGIPVDLQFHISGLLFRDPSLFPISADGIIIPQSYTSFLAPIMSQTLFNDISRYSNEDRYKYSAFETQY